MKITKTQLRKIIQEAIQEEAFGDVGKDTTGDAGSSPTPNSKSALQAKAGGSEAARTQVASWLKPISQLPQWKKIKDAIAKGGPSAQLQAIDLLLSGEESLVGLSPDAVKAFANQISTAVKQG